MTEKKENPFNRKYTEWREREWANYGRLKPVDSSNMNFQPDDDVLSCEKIESGLRLGDDAIRACCMGAIVSPMYWSAEEAGTTTITKDMIVAKRRTLFEHLNDENAGYISCKRCQHVKTKKFRDVRFDRFGHINLGHFSACNLRCRFCGYTQYNHFIAAKYDALPILEQFSPKDTEWDSFVDLNGGEPTLLKDLPVYIDYFRKMGSKILLYTNGVIYSQAVSEGIMDGSITWAVVSLDSGSPSGFRKLKGRDKYECILENLVRYARAGSQGYGNLAVKYIFSEGNLSDDDIVGFVFAMLAIRPQKVWLTFDFYPLTDTYEGQAAPGEYDYSEHIKSYAKMFVMLRKYGIEPAHFAKTHLAQVHQAGKDLLQCVYEEIEKISSRSKSSVDLVPDNTAEKKISLNDVDTLLLNPPRIKSADRTEKALTLGGRRILLAPACSFSVELLDDPEFRNSKILGFLDRSPVLQKKKIMDYAVYPYEKLKELEPDTIIVAGPNQHQKAIIQEVAEKKSEASRIFLLEGMR